MTYLIHHFLENSADVYPDKEAFVHSTLRLAYKDIELRCNKLANWLLSRHLPTGARVALLLRNSAAYVYAYYGVLKAGGVVVPLNTGLEPIDIKRMLDDCEPEIFISEKYFAKAIRYLSDNLNDSFETLVGVDDVDMLKVNWSGEYISLSEIFNQSEAFRPNISLVQANPASIIYTSGSTGKPKGAALSHQNVVSNTRSITEYLRLNERDRCIVVLPFYYVYGKSLLNTHFAVAGSIVVDNRFAFPNTVLKNMIAEKATGFAGVSSTYSILLNRSSITKMNFPHLRYLTQAGGHMPSKVKNGLLQIFPDKDIFIMYGATEASARLSYLPPDELTNRINSIGMAIPNVEMKVVDENGNATAPNEEGEIVARGENIMTGYWNSPQETQKVLKDGWYYTGDLGVKDEAGYFYITGRKSEMIKVGIYKISAIEIEEVLYGHSDVQDAAVIGVPDETLGEVIIAIVVLQKKDTIDAENIINFCKDRLPAYKVPRDVIFVNDLPKNETGKIMKNKLREAFSNS